MSLLTPNYWRKGMNKILQFFCDLFKPMTEQAKINSEFYISELESAKILPEEINNEHT